MCRANSPRAELEASARVTCRSSTTRAPAENRGLCHPSKTRIAAVLSRVTASWLPMRATFRVRSRSTAAVTVWRSAIRTRRREGKGGEAPARELRPRAGLRRGSKGGEAPLASPCRGPAKRGPKGYAGLGPLRGHEPAVDRPRIGPQRLVPQRLGPASGSRRSRARYPAQSFISRRRRSNRSVRRYAASTRLRTLCASAASATSGG